MCHTVARPATCAPLHAPAWRSRRSSACPDASAPHHAAPAPSLAKVSQTTVSRQASPEARGTPAAGLVAFICNLVVAAWIKFGEEDLYTPVLVTVTLAACLFGMARSIALWAPHLFQRADAAHASGRSDTVVQLGEEYGLPFAWHRVPQPMDDLVRPAPRSTPPLPCYSAHAFPTPPRLGPACGGSALVPPAVGAGFMCLWQSVPC